jgi:stage V sporulation protein AD
LISSAAVCGGLESQGPLKEHFDLCSDDSKFGMDTWEKSEAEMIRCCTETAIKKANCCYEDIDLAFSGDLINQCASSTFGLKDKQIPHIGLYGACSTFALATGMASLAIEGCLAETALAVSSSHYSTAERQYRFPLEYGCQRTPTSQTTVTAAGCVILKELKENDPLPYVSEFFPGIITDLGITDANNMGAAMAPSCANTIKRYFEITKKNPLEFDWIVTGDLGYEGHRILLDLCKLEGLDISENCIDCGMMIYDANQQKVQSGGSGCGCSASVFSGFLLSEMICGKIKDILLIGTGALLNAGTVLQKESIPGISHLLRIRKD